MKDHFSCDDVFEILTRAPFPTGEPGDTSVEMHLAVCHDCRQLAEALRPATDLFSEVMTAEERRSLPSYRGQAAAVMDRVRRESVSTARRNAPAQPIRGWKRFIPAIGLALLLMIAVARDPRGPDGIVPGSIPSAPTALDTSQDPCLLAGFSLPVSCLPRSAVGPARAERGTNHFHSAPPADPLRPDPDYSRYLQPLVACQSCHEAPRTVAHREVCCTNCHSANKAETAVRPWSVPRLVAACSACHL